MPVFFYRLRTFFSAHFVSIVLIAIVALIGVVSIHPDQYLIGWDVTAPELNSGLNLKRSFFGIWQTYRGLGTLDGMAHTANIVHILWMSIWKTIVGIQLARPTWLLILFGLGMTGAATLAQLLLQPVFSRFRNTVTSIASLIAGLFYGLNLYSLQMFYAPLEVFAYQFVLLPWLLWSAIRYLQRKNTRSLALFGLITLLGVGQAHVPTVFISTTLFLGILLTAHLIASKKQVKFVAVLIGIYLSINAFWIVPYSYSALYKPSVIAQSQINLLSTPEITARNQAWGTLARVATLGSFNLDYLDWEKSTLKMQYMMPEWREHYFSIWYQVVTIVLSVIALTGSVLMVQHERKINRSLLWVPASFVLFFALLATDSFLFGWVTKLLTMVLPLFGELFRFTFTKFSQPFALSFSMSLAFATVYILVWLQANGFQKLQKVLVALLLVCLLIHSAPIWKNGLFYKNIWVTIPTEYFAAAEYLNANASDWEKVAVLPSPTLYGWTSNNWGYRGSGFLWQMTKPALLDRSFDAWSGENETYYQQLDTAVSTQDETAFFQVMEKYQVSEVLYDSSFNTGTSQLQLAENTIIQQWLSKEASAVFRKGTITIYSLNQKPLSSVAVVSGPKQVAGSDSKTQSIAIESPYFQAIDSETQSHSVEYPFLFLDSENLTHAAVEYANKELTLPIPTSSNQGDIVFAKPTDNSLITLPFTVKRSGDQLVFTSQDSGAVTQSNGLSVPIRIPLTFSHQLKTQSTTVMADINGQLVTIFSDEQPTVWLTRLQAQQPIVIRTFLPEQTTAEAEVLNVTGAIDQTIVPASVWTDLKEIRVSATTSSMLQAVTIRTYTASVPLENGAPVENCDSLSRGKVEETRENNLVTLLSSDSANACKGFPLAPASSHDSFFVEILADTDANNGLLTGVQSWSQPRSAVYQLLPNTASRLFLSIPSAQKLAERNVSLIFENRSFSERINTATVERISVIIPAFSVDYLKNIRVVTNQAATPSNSKNTYLPESTPLNPTQLSVNVTENADQQGLVLLQSFDQGWIAFPALQPWKAFEHVKYNGWANGWIVPAGQKSMRITILYWPQLLTYIGFGILLTTLAGLGWYGWREKDTAAARFNKKIDALFDKIRSRLESR